MVGKVGRPRKVYKDGQEPRYIHIVLTKEIVDAMGPNVNASEEARKYFYFRFVNPIKGKLEELKKERDKLQNQLVIINLQIQELEKEMAEQEELKKLIELKDLYAIWVFWNIVKDSTKKGILVWTDYDKVESLFGVTMNFKELEKDIKKKEIIQYSIETFEQAKELAKKYDVKYLGNGIKEEEEFNKFKRFYDNYKKEVKI
ncbi:MAG: hypothetical protein RXO36_05350 [Candidatus Nanopusillus acidilobi]